MFLIVYQVLPSFCFYSTLAEVSSTKWFENVGGKLPLSSPSTMHIAASLYEQPKAPKREGQTLKAVIFTPCNPYTISGVSNWLADICNI